MMEEIADKLWEMLDAVDAASEAFRGDHEGFRVYVRETSGMRHELMTLSPDTGERCVVMHDYECEHCGATWSGSRLEYECSSCECPMGVDLHVRHAGDSCDTEPAIS